MFVLADIEDLIQAYPEHTPDTTDEYSNKVTQLQLLEAVSAEQSRGYPPKLWAPHPALVAAALTNLAMVDGIPHSGRNIPETGQ